MQIISSVYQAQQKYSQCNITNDDNNADNDQDTTTTATTTTTTNNNNNNVIYSNGKGITNNKIKTETTESNNIHHKTSYSTIHSTDRINDDIQIIHTNDINNKSNNHNGSNDLADVADNIHITPISNNTENTKIIMDTIAPNNHLSNLSQLTVNDTTISSFDNDLLLEDPLSIDESSNINNYDISNLVSINNQILTLNDMDPQIKDTELPDIINKNLSSKDKKIKIDNKINNLVSIQDNQLIINDLYINLNFDFDIDSSDYSNSSTNSSSIPIINQLNILTPNNSTNLKLNNNSQKSNSNSTNSYPYSNSNLNTPSSKLFSNSDISINHLKRSFTRLKQTSELLNTEKVYICSLKILEEVYLNNFMSDTKTPIYFDIFKNCVSKLLENHQKFYDNLNLIYNKWYIESISFVKNDLNLNDSNLSSPNFEKFNYVLNERDYLESVINLILNDSINVEVYSIYCSLFQRILKFSTNKGIENYKRNSLIILNDYLVDHKNLEADYFIDKHLDRRFISVVQMPTNRIVRYKLILKSLLKNIEIDENDKLKLKFYSKVLENINLKIDEINSYVGNEDLKLQKLEKFKKLIDNKNNKLYLADNLFLENLENLQLSSSFELIYPIKSKNYLIHSEYVCGFLFKSHLILAKPSHIISNSLDIKFIIPLLSISKIFDNNFNNNLTSNYNEKINLRFENDFKIYEICFIFPDEKEKLLWEGQLKVNYEKFSNLNNMKSNELNDNNNKFIFSDIRSKILSIDLSSEIEKFNVTSNIPSTINPIIRYKNNEIIKTDNIYNFEIDNFLTHLNTNNNKNNNNINSNKVLRSDSTHSLSSNYSIDIDNNSIKTKNSLININHLANKIPIIKITLQDRVYAQTCIKSVWSQQFQIYTLNASISRSLSNLFHSKISLLSLSSHNDFNNNNNSTDDHDNNNSNNKLLNNNFIPPSPSFVLNGGPSGSPIKLRNAKSMKTLRDVVGRNSISSPKNHNLLPPTPTINTNMNGNTYDIKSETTSKTKNNSNNNSTINSINTSINNNSNNHSSYNSSHHSVRKSGSLRSLSSFISSGVNSSSKSIISNTTINYQNPNNCHNHHQYQHHNNVSNNTISESSSSVSLSKCESNHLMNKKNKRVSKFWKNLTIKKDKS